MGILWRFIHQLLKVLHHCNKRCRATIIPIRLCDVSFSLSNCLRLFKSLICKICHHLSEEHHGLRLALGDFRHIQHCHGTLQQLLDRVQGLTEVLVRRVVFRLGLKFVRVFGEVGFGFYLLGLVVDLVELLYKVLLRNRRQLHARELGVNDGDCVSQLQQDLDSLYLLCLAGLFGFVFNSETVEKFSALNVTSCPKIGIDRLALDQAHQQVCLSFSSGMSFQSLFGF